MQTAQLINISQLLGIVADMEKKRYELELELKEAYTNIEQAKNAFVEENKYTDIDRKEFIIEIEGNSYKVKVKNSTVWFNKIEVIKA